MASEIRVDTSKNTSGLCTVTYSNTGAVLSGITTASGVIDAQGYINLAQKIIHTGDADTSIEFPSNDTIKFETAGGERLRILSNGRVGVGTDSPLSVLTAYGENRGEGTVTGQITAKDNAAYNASPTAGLVFQGHYASNNAQAIFAGITGFKENANDGNYAGALAFHTRENGSVAEERLRITSAGKVGIKTDNPQEMLQVGDGSGTTGGLKVAGQSSSVTDDGLTLDWTASNEARLFSESSGNATMHFYTTSSGTRGERLRILSAGEVLIGGRTAKPNDINKLVVTGTSPADAYDSQLYLEGSETSGAVDTGGALAFGGHDGSNHRNWASIYGMKENGTGGNQDAYLSFHTRANGGNPTEKLRITSGGNTKFWGTRSGALQANDNDNLLLYTKSTSDDINRGSGITFYNHDGSGYEMGGTIQVAKENGTTDDAKAYMRFSTQNGSTTSEALRITSAGRIGINQETPDARLHIAGTNDAIIRLESTDTGLGQDELVGAVEFEKNDASGAGAGVCGGVRCYSEDSYGARTYLAFSVRVNSTGQAATDTEICRITRHGLIFDTSVTGSDSAKALDSYEEGTWQPTLSFGGGSTGLTYSSRSGSYIKIGSYVYCVGQLDLSAKGSSTGNAVFGNLPFNAGDHVSGSSQEGSGTLTWWQSMGTNLNYPTSFWVSESTTGATIYTGNGSAVANLTHSDFGSSSQFRFVVQYRTAT